MDPNKKTQNRKIDMKQYIQPVLYILLLSLLLTILAISCKPQPTPSKPQPLDSVYTTMDLRLHGDYYESGHSVYSLDLLSEGLAFDSLGYIVGTGCNLYLSDIFVHIDSTLRLPAGEYLMDSTAREMRFLPGMDFEGNVTGTYLLVIEDNQLKRIQLFETGSMQVEYDEDDVEMSFLLYSADSTMVYRATYNGVTDTEL